jgi:Glycosyl transferase family 2
MNSGGIDGGVGQDLSRVLPQAARLSAGGAARKRTLLRKVATAGRRSWRLCRALWHLARVGPAALCELQSLQEQLAVLREDLEAFKCSVDVPDELWHAFQEWRRSHPIPAEPVVSVAVVTWNRTKLLTERCLPSILDQNYQRLQVVVVGDGSPTDTEKKVRAFRDPRLVFHNLPERGWFPSHPVRKWRVAGMEAANKARELCSGDFFTMLDDDDEYLPGRIEKLVDFAVARQCDFVWHPFWWQDENGSWLLNNADAFARGKVTSGSVFYRGWFKHILGDVRAHFLNEAGDWNRFRKFKYLDAVCERFPEPLLRKYTV